MSNVTFLDPQIVRIDYTNHRGERRSRLVKPLGIFYGCNEWHPEMGWLLTAGDVEDGNQVKTFSLNNVHSWGEQSVKA